MIQILKWLFLVTGIIGFLLLITVDGRHRGHEDDFKTTLTGIGLIISSIILIILLVRIELFLEKNKERYGKYKQRFAWSVLLIIGGAFCLIYVLIDVIQSTKNNVDGIIAAIGAGYLFIGVLMYRSVFQ